MHALFQLDHIKPAVKEAIRRKNLSSVQTSSPLVKITTRDISGPNVLDNSIEDIVLESKPKSLPPLLKQDVDKQSRLSEYGNSTNMDMTQSSMEDFAAMQVSAANTRVLDPLAVCIVEEKNEQDLKRKTGKKLFNTDERTDWRRVGYGGNKDDHMSFDYDENMNLTVEPSKVYNDVEDQYQTMSDKYYPKLIYQPSKPVTRDIIGDAMNEANRKRQIREERYKRKLHNTNITATRIEFEELEREMREKRNEQRRAQDMVRFVKMFRTKYLIELFNT
jgi:hypothetical protein